MPNVIETNESRQRRKSTGKDSTAKLQFIVVDASDEDAAETAALSAIGAIESSGLFLALVRQTLETVNLGGDCFEVVANYVDVEVERRESTPESGEGTFEFDTTGGTFHITQSKATTKYARSGAAVTAPDHKGAIGVTKDGVTGVDVVIPALKFSIRYRMPHGNITLAYIRTLRSLTGKVNNATFKGFAAGEVLFLGATGQQALAGDVEVKFNFLVSENLTGLDIGDITGIAKDGHQYLWVYYLDGFDSSASALVKEPLAVYVETVYEETDFADLGTGT